VSVARTYQPEPSIVCDGFCDIGFFHTGLNQETQHCAGHFDEDAETSYGVLCGIISMRIMYYYSYTRIFDSPDLLMIATNEHEEESDACACKPQNNNHHSAAQISIFHNTRISEHFHQLMKTSFVSYFIRALRWI
jgi:hypothetical protein